MRKLTSFVGSIVLAAGLAPATLIAESEYYTWVDENGVTNYAEKEPPGYNATYVTRESRFGYSSFRPQGDALPETAETEPEDAASPEDAAPENDEDIDKMVADERARVDAEIAAAKRSNCQIGRRNLAQLEAYARIRVKDEENGGERVLTDAEKAQRIKKAKQTIRENCSG